MKTLGFFVCLFLIVQISSGYKSTVKVFHYRYLVSVSSVVCNLGLSLVSVNYTYFDVWVDTNKVI